MRRSLQYSTNHVVWFTRGDGVRVIMSGSYHRRFVVISTDTPRRCSAAIVRAIKGASPKLVSLLLLSYVHGARFTDDVPDMAGVSEQTHAMCNASRTHDLLFACRQEE